MKRKKKSEEPDLESVCVCVCVCVCVHSERYWGRPRNKSRVTLMIMK